MNRRIVGYDFARSLAVLGMVVVNFKVVMGAEKAGSHYKNPGSRSSWDLYAYNLVEKREFRITTD